MLSKITGWDVGAVEVQTTATRILTYAPTARRVVLMGAPSSSLREQQLYLGRDNTVTTTTGFPLTPDQPLEFVISGDMELWAIADGSNVFQPNIGYIVMWPAAVPPVVPAGPWKYRMFGVFGASLSNEVSRVLSASDTPRIVYARGEQGIVTLGVDRSAVSVSDGFIVTDIGPGAGGQSGLAGTGARVVLPAGRELWVYQRAYVSVIDAPFKVVDGVLAGFHGAALNTAARAVTARPETQHVAVYGGPTARQYLGRGSSVTDTNGFLVPLTTPIYLAVPPGEELWVYDTAGSENIGLNVVW